MKKEKCVRNCEEKIVIPILRKDKINISRQAEAVRLPLAAFCRLILINNLNKNSSPCAEFDSSAQGVLADLQDHGTT